jgi:adenine-specific DNA-methyltransferase
MRSAKGRTTNQDHAKANGVHYTPPELAAFLAEVMAKTVRDTPLRVLDPACGDGELLLAFVKAMPASSRRRLILEGYETDAAALARTGKLLAKTGVQEIVLKHQDFLSEEGVGFCTLHGTQPSLFGNEDSADQQYDVVIANPPYVRTQLLGAERSQGLAKKFSLSGRVDLYHAFAMGMASVLKPGGVLGLLTSNRFLTIKSGASLRQLLSAAFDLEAIYDLGDTKLFSAAVLPVILIGRKGRSNRPGTCIFDRVYEHRCNGGDSSVVRHFDSVLDALRDRSVSGVVRTSSGAFCVERGTLVADGGAWSLSTAEVEKWLDAVRKHETCCFGQLSKVRVGIKTTADEVFIRDDWDSLPKEMRPEAGLLRPLLTHFNANRWLPCSAKSRKQVLYPHAVLEGRRSAIDLADYPGSAAYLDSHKARLMRRKYVIDAGRKWYEIWVPQNPDDWSRPKIVYPDITEYPRFFFDASGAIVNGDCYWITLNRGIEEDWLLLMLAVANSTFITKYYDTVFHNKLYSGRRRFMTQYVANFPLPDLGSPIGREIVDLVSRLLNHDVSQEAIERQINALVWNSFGLSEELGPVRHR